jgi:hypothetical protein
MDFKKLIEPYSEGGLRTIEAQIKWLLSKGIPRHHIDQAILTVYQEVEHGRQFTASESEQERAEGKTAGHYLDHEIFRVAKELYQAELSESVQKLEDFHNGLVDKHMKRGLNRLQRFGKWLFRL